MWIHIRHTPERGQPASYFAEVTDAQYTETLEAIGSRSAARSVIHFHSSLDAHMNPESRQHREFRANSIRIEVAQ